MMRAEALVSRNIWPASSANGVSSGFLGEVNTTLAVDISKGSLFRLETFRILAFEGPLRILFSDRDRLQSLIRCQRGARWAITGVGV
jgi:hypothetical protein